MDQNDQGSEAPRPPPGGDSLMRELDELRRESARFGEDLDAVAIAAWERIRARHPETKAWSQERLMDEIDGEIRLLGRISRGTAVRLRVRMHLIASGNAEKLREVFGAGQPRGRER